MKRKFPCLMYHEIAYPYKHKFYVKPDNFRKQIDYLSDNGYKSIDLRKIDSYGDKHVLITFDDGHKSNLEAAKYLFDKGLFGVFYLVKNFSLNDPDYLSEKNIMEIGNMGHILGVHGKDHDWWTNKTEDLLIEGLCETAKWIENLTGQKVVTCSAPGGKINEQIYRVIEKNIPTLRYIRSSSPWMNNIGRTRVFSTAIKFSTKKLRFRMIINGNIFIYLYLQLLYKLKNILRPIYSKIIKAK